MNDELTELLIEARELKKCQIDLLKMCFTFFAAIPPILGLFIYTDNSLFFLKNIGSLSVITSSLFILLMLSIVPLLFPYITWIIIHKSRSLFRITAYLRFKREAGNDEEIYYEQLYREMRNDPWMRCRFFGCPWKDFKSRWWNYEKWERRYEDISKENFEELKNDLKNSYKGGFYARIVRMISYMILIYLILLLAYAGYCIYFILTDENVANWLALIYIAFILVILIYSFYNFRLNRRYEKELTGIPFSQDTQYLMWKQAHHRMKKTLTNRSS